jgi:hypothetical protein
MAKRLQHDMTPPRNTVPLVVGAAVGIVAIFSLAVWSFSNTAPERANPVATMPSQQPKG